MKSKNSETIFAFKMVWIIISLLMIIIILSSKFLNPEYLKLIPQCSAKASHDTCCFCGMSRAFIQIGLLNFRDALVLNRGSIILFVSMLLNGLFFIAFSTFKLINHFKPKNS
ncbi:DUF2752 domain-containing protein [Pedobacter petrophilus]|uniref:DUF2752 domain-containing protein n=1 Tax=Pedobacter petrophilus TaxID=1908241 RepID=A0A7K0G0Y9_9SPHI|nr:DUF2752 domain-containing protein [Pedobacter petrophilus]